MHSIEDPAGHLQIFWDPPTLFSDEPGSQNVSIDSRITHFILYIITNESTTDYNASWTNFTIEIYKIPCSFWFQVAAVNPAGVGECSPPQNSSLDCEFANNIILYIMILINFVTYYRSRYRVLGFHEFNCSH